MRRRRRNRSTWFPVVPTYVGEGSGIGYTWFQYGQILPATYAASQAIATPLVPDTTITPEQTDGQYSSLRDFVEGQTWTCERVVGSIFCHCNNSTELGVGALICCAALAVLPIDVSDGSDPDVPELLNDDYQPLAAQNAYNPWLWRRTWLLGNPGLADTQEFAFLPTSNTYYGDMRSGTHLDTKGTKRSIQREQRLFLVTQIGSANLGVDPDNGTNVHWTYDLRILGGMRTAKNRSTFK